MTKKKVSVVVPVYYNEGSLIELYQRITALFRENNSIEYEIIFVNDGSLDGSHQIILGFTQIDPNIKYIKLSKNFGSFNACLAGLSYTTGDCVTIISADLQDPPEYILDMYKKWENGTKVVLAVREKRNEKFAKILCSKIYYKIFRAIISKEMPPGGFDFVLLDKIVVKNLCMMKEKNTSLMALILWCGFPREEIYYTRLERKHGESQWTLRKKINYFIDTIFSFSTSPVKLITSIGMMTTLISLFGIMYIIIAYFLGLMAVPGWASLVIINLFMWGTIMFSLGIISEYSWRSLNESRNRPSFIIESIVQKDTVFQEENYVIHNYKT